MGHSSVRRFIALGERWKGKGNGKWEVEKGTMEGSPPGRDRQALAAACWPPQARICVRFLNCVLCVTFLALGILEIAGGRVCIDHGRCE